MQPIKYLGNGKYLLRAKTEPDAEGICHSKSKTIVAKNWQDAERQLRILIREAAKAKPATKKESKSKNMSVSELLDLYVAAKKLEGKSVTYLDKIDNYRKRIDEAFKGRTIADLTVARIDKFSNNLSKCTNRHDEYTYKKAGGKGQIRQISDEYKYQIQALLLSAIQWADKKGYLTDNVTHRVTKLKKGEYDQIEIPDINAVIDFIDFLIADEGIERHYKIFMVLASWCGLRREEILGLRWKNMDLNNKRIKIESSEVKHTGVSRYVKGPKTKSSKRLVIVPSRVLNILKDWKSACDQKRPTWKNHASMESKIPNDHVIVNLQDGSLPYPDTFTGWAADYIKKHDFNRITPHGLRHFYATYLLLKGVDVKTVQTLAGHSSPRITLKIYAAVTQEGFEKAEAVLDAI